MGHQRQGPEGGAYTPGSPRDCWDPPGLGGSGGDGSPSGLWDPRESTLVALGPGVCSSV